MNKRSTCWLPVLALSLAVSACDYVPDWMGGGEEQKARLPGERITVLPVGSAVTPDAELKTLAVALPAPVPNTEWPQHTGIFTSASANLAAAGEFTDSTSASAGDGESFEHTLVPRPVVAQGLVFAMDAAGNISAHDVADISTVRWQSAGVAEEDEPQIIGGGLAYNQGRLYATSGRGAVAAIDAATGKEIWKKSIRIPFRSAPKIAGNTLFAITIDNQVYAINTANGDILWSQRGINESAGILNSISPTVVSGIAIVPFSSGELYGLAVQDGRELWNTSLAVAARTQAMSIFSGIGGDPVVDNDVVFAVSAGGMLSVISLWNGQRIWDKPIASINTPWVAGDYLYLLTADNTLVCFIKYSGRVRWATQLPSFEDMEAKKHPITWSGPVLVSGRLAIVGSRGEMMLVSAADGSIVSTVEIPDDIYTPPVIAGGQMYLINQSATLYSLK